MSNLIFKRLNDGWNAEPNAPDPRVAVGGSDIELIFFLNPFAYEAGERESGCLIFKSCARWRLGPTNDEGWYAGRCRYSKAAPAWGEFYELLGDDSLRPLPTDWRDLRQLEAGHRHFLFYLRDETFECVAADWELQRGNAAALRAAVGIAKDCLEGRITALQTGRPIIAYINPWHPAWEASNGAHGPLSAFYVAAEEADRLHFLGEDVERWHPDVRETKRHELAEAEAKASQTVKAAGATRVRRSVISRSGQCGTTSDLLKAGGILM